MSALKNEMDQILVVSEHAKTTYENKILNQSSLFSDDTNKISYLLHDKNESDWPNEETLANEFESVGFYISNHPLIDFEPILKQYNVKQFKYPKY